MFSDTWTFSEQLKELIGIRGLLIIDNNVPERICADINIILNTQEIIIYEKEIIMKQLERQLKREIELDANSSLGPRLY